MIVTCNNCDTSFQLDESRVPEQGIRVRCSRCKEAFFLAHPSVSASSAVHEIAADAAAGRGTPSPGVTQDLTAPVAAAEPTPENAAPANDDEEHDWEFNVDPPAATSASGPPAVEGASFGEVDGSEIGAVDEASGSGLALENEATPDVADAAAGAADASAFGSVDDYSSLMPEDESGSSTAGGGGTDANPAIEEAGHWAPAAGRYAEAGASDDLGDPESWDFFGDESTGASAGAGATRSAPGAVLGRIALTTAPADSVASLGAAAPDLTEWDDDPYEEVEETSGPGLVLRTIGAVGHAVGWAITLSLVAIGGVSGFWSTAESLVSSPQDVRLGTIEARGMTGHWVDTARGETLLWVKGELVNGASAMTLLDGVLEVSLLDAQGRLLETDPQPAALALAEADVRELAPRSLRIAVDRAAWGLAHEPLTPNQPVTFHAVFDDVPSAAARFALAIADGPTVATGAIAGPSGASMPVEVDGAMPLSPATGGGALPEPSAAAEADVTPGPRPEAQPLADDLTWGE